MARPPPIYAIPESLQQYKTERVDHPWEPCCACWREFGEKDDPTDANEMPCRPLRLLPCRHIVGHQCLREMKKRGISHCPMCRTRIVTVPLRSIRIAQRIADITMLRFAVDLVVRHIQERTNAESYNTLLRRLFAGDIEFGEALKLWWIHMRAWFALITRIGFVLVLRNTLIVHLAHALVIWMVAGTSLWAPLYNFFICWGLATTYEDISMSYIEYIKSTVKGFAVTGGLSVVFLAYCIGNLIWAGADMRWPEITALSGEREGQMRRQVVLVRVDHMFSKPNNWSPHTRYKLLGTGPESPFQVPDYEIIYKDDGATFVPWRD